MITSVMKIDCLAFLIVWRDFSKDFILKKVSHDLECFRKENIIIIKADRKITFAIMDRNNN